MSVAHLLFSVYAHGSKPTGPRKHVPSAGVTSNISRHRRIWYVCVPKRVLIVSDAAQIKEMVSVLVGRAQLMPADETPEEHSTLRAEESAQLERDKANKHETTGGLFRGCFRRKCPALMVIRDPEDGVDRCPLCSWELELGRCERCHLAFDEHGRAQDYTPFYDSADTDIDAYGGFSDEELDDDLDLQDDEMEIGFETYYSAISRGAIVRGAITQGKTTGLRKRGRDREEVGLRTTRCSRCSPCRRASGRSRRFWWTS